MTEGTPETSLGPLVTIGHVRTDADDETVRREWDSLVSRIEVLPAYEPALLGVDGFSHLIVVSWLDRIGVEQRQILQVKPRGLLRFGVRLEELPTIGVFACDSPARPNPIGISMTEVVERSGRILRVRGLDVFDGTPVLDLKPYTPDRAVRGPTAPEWHSQLLAKADIRRV